MRVRRRTTGAGRSSSPWRRLFDYGLTVTILGLLILLAARLDQPDMSEREGRPVVNDGDSLTLGTERVRLRGIDAPEYAQNCQRNGIAYACGRKAREALVQAVGGRPVSCSGSERDRYGRLLAYCTAGKIDLNRAQVEAGWAIAYGGYEAEEAKAKAKGAGIWAGSFERPQDWRRRHNAAPDPKHDDPLARIGDWLWHALRFWR
jgi:endonuclease YncB( thermonuclease family)